MDGIHNIIIAPEIVKSLTCDVDRKRDSSGLDVALESAPKLCGKVAGPSHVSGKLVGRLQSEILPGRATFLSY